MQVVHNALAVLEEVARRQPISLAELHRRVGLPKTTVHRALVALNEAGWIRATTGHRWTLAPRAVVLAARASDEEGLRDLALPIMEGLRDETGEAVHLTVRDGRAVVLIERVDSPRAVRTFNPLGTRAPVHASANGKAILSRLPRIEAEEAVSAVLAAFTESTQTDPAVLLAELRQSRERGWATNQREFIPEVAAVAAAILNRNGSPIAGLSVSAPADRLPETLLPKVGALVVEAAARISEQLGFDGRGVDVGWN